MMFSRGPRLLQIADTLGKRIAKDIEIILQKGWASEISPRDFYHGHVCSIGKEGPMAKFVNNTQTARDHAEVPYLLDRQILYHTHEFDDIPSLDRNILSPGNNRTPVRLTIGQIRDFKRKAHEEKRIEEKREFTIHASDLDLYHLFDVHFTPTQEGRYLLSNGQRIEIYAADYSKQDPPKLFDYNLF